jgi:hypothetical protein
MGTHQRTVNSVKSDQPPSASWRLCDEHNLEIGVFVDADQPASHHLTLRSQRSATDGKYFFLFERVKHSFLQTFWGKSKV